MIIIKQGYRDAGVEHRIEPMALETSLLGSGGVRREH